MINKVIRKQNMSIVFFASVSIKFHEKFLEFRPGFLQMLLFIFMQSTKKNPLHLFCKQKILFQKEKNVALLGVCNITYI